jgi:hypothetical protein
MTVDKVRENRLRRMAARQGFILQKSARRDPRARDYARFRLIADSREAYEPGFDGGEFTLSVSEVEQFLTQLAE